MGNRNWEHEAGIVWPILVEAARNKQKLHYADIAKEISTNPLSVGNSLYPIMDYCIENRLPPLTVLVVGKISGVPGSGFNAWDVDDIETAYQVVFSYGWDSVKNPFKGFEETDTTESLALSLVNNPGSSGDVYSKVRNRGMAQRIFRSALLIAYDSKCAICGLSFESALEAAHIISWNDALPEERISPTNGILLCSNHHRLFDSKYIHVNRKYEVVYSDPDMVDGEYSETDKAVVAEYHGSKISLPGNTMNWPSVDFLSKRIEKQKSNKSN